jgi:hypothetical protein
LYYAIKELATHADKTDDLLVQEFSGLQHIDNEHINPIDKRIKKVMYDFVQQRIKEVVQCVDHPSLNMMQYPGAESYLYLDLLYGIDYLTKPEGNTMKKIEDVHQWYFNEKVLSPIQKNQKIRMAVEEIKSTTFESFDKELYRVKSTFGITQQSGQDRIQRFIEGELDNMDWYYQEGHEQVALSIPGFIVGYCLYNYSMPFPLRKLFQLYYRVIHNDYFEVLGFESLKDHKKLHTRKIKQKIQNIIKEHASTYSELKFDYKILQYDDLCLFAKSYLSAVKSLDFSRTDLM